MNRRHPDFRMPPLALAGLFFVQLASVAQLPNAWQIADNSTAGGSTLGYTNLLCASHAAAATNTGFRLTVNARFLADFGGSKVWTARAEWL